MGEIKSNVGAASGHSGAIGSAAGSLMVGLSPVEGTQTNKMEASLMNCFSSIQSAVAMMSSAVTADAASIQAIGNSISSMDDRLSKGFLP